MVNLLTKARSGRSNAIKSLTENRMTGETFVMSNGRRSARPVKRPPTAVFMSIRSDAAPDPVVPVAAARIKAEKAFLAASMATGLQTSLVH